MQIELSDLVEMLKTKKSNKRDDSHWEIGKAYFIRTVTHHLTGRLLKVTSLELVLEDAAWIADDGRFADLLTKFTPNEVEPYPDGAKVIVGRTSIIDAVEWQAKLPRTQK